MTADTAKYPTRPEDTGVRSPDLAIALGLVFLIFVSYRFAIPVITLDMNEYLLPWLSVILREGPGSLSAEFANYTPPYIYLLFLASPLAGILDPVALIKSVSILFNFAGAAVFGAVVFEATRNRRTAFLAGCAFSLVPTVALNSVWWGQCDIIYTTFLLAALWASLRRRPLAMAVLFGVALCFKFQAIFLSPYIMYLILRREMSPFHLLVVPAVYALMMVPAWLAGRDAWELLTISLSQGATYHLLSMNAPNMWYVLQRLPFVSYEAGVVAGLIGTVAAFSWFLCRIYPVEPEVPPTEMKILVAVFSVMLAPYLIPKMHDRYFFAADVFSLLFVFLGFRLKLVPLLVQLGSLFAYVAFLTQSPDGSGRIFQYVYFFRGQTVIGSVLMTAAIWLVGRTLFRLIERHREGFPAVRSSG